MKFLVYAFFAVMITTMSYSAEVLVQDSVVTSPAYKMDAFYSFSEGKTVATADVSDWDIAFEINGTGYSILNNGGWGSALYHKEGMTKEDFENDVDVEDVKSNWTELYNSRESWAIGAFVSNQDLSNDFDLGWGEYSLANHSIFATTFYVIKTMKGDWKKIIINSLINREYSFTIANLDGSDMITKTLAKDDYPKRNFVYYSIDNDTFLDREPNIDSWDLYFSKYINMEGENADTPYPVTGVKTNPKIKSIRVETADPKNINMPDTTEFNTSITNIGSNWKSFNGEKYVVRDDLVIFTYREIEKNIFQFYRVIFNGFSGSAEGKYYFQYSNLATSVSDNSDGNQFAMALYPNVINRGQNVSLVSTVVEGTNSAIEIYSSMGQLVWSSNYQAVSDMSNIQLPTNGLSAGMYLVSIRNNDGIATQKLIVK